MTASESDETVGLQFDGQEKASAFYRDRLGWPTAHGSVQVWIPPQMKIETVSIPAAVGRSVLSRLPEPAPVMHSPGPPDCWIVLTQAFILGQDIRTLPVTVEHIWGGALIWLPPSRWGENPLSWVTSPECALPTFRTLSDVIDSVFSERYPNLWR